jgi:hypothetical protein
MASIAWSRNFWQRWRRGIRAIFHANAVLFVIYFLAVPMGWLLKLVHPVPALEVMFAIVVLIVLFVLMPLAVSGLMVDPESVNEAIVARVEPKIDAIAVATGVSWSASYLSEVEELLRGGRTDRAKAVYREKAGVSWDYAHQAVLNWATTRLERKLDILARNAETRPDRVVARPG